METFVATLLLFAAVMAFVAAVIAALHPFGSAVNEREAVLES